MGAGLAAQEHSKAHCSSLRSTRPGLSPATTFTWELRSPSRPEANVPAIKRTNVYKVPTVYQATHTQDLLVSSLAKPAHPACWGKFLGRQHGPQVRHVRARNSTLFVLFPLEAVTPRMGRSVASFGGSFRFVWDGRGAGAP